MAGNKVNTKTKGREDKGKVNKGVSQNNDDCEEMTDFAVLRKPIPTSVTGFAQARKIFDLATEELKDLLANECDLMYECKVCRNIFRSLANFISHKRVYCKEKFSSTVHGHFGTSASTEKEMIQIKHTEDTYQESLKNKTSTDSNEAVENDDRVPLTKDLTAVYEKLINSKGLASKEEPLVVLKKIPSSSVAVFQNLDFKDKPTDNMRTEVQELDEILSRKRAVLQSNGKFIIEDENVKVPRKQDSENVIQISDDDDNENGDELKCKICELQFSTQKTLKFHMKYKHLESRLVYPCPDCLEIFSTSWSVYRHLFKVHRKSAAQIRRLRESIQSKAFKMNNPPAFYEKRKNLKPVAPQQITEEERRDQENQAWMDNMEGDGEVPRCGGCGRTFERRAALAAHTHTCQPRSRALAAHSTQRPDKRIEIQIRKDYHKVPPAKPHVNTPPENKIVPEETEAKTKPPQREEEDRDEEEEDEAPMDLGDDDQMSNASADSPEKANELTLQDNIKPIIRLPHALQAEKSNLAAFKQRILPDVDFAKLHCKKCNSELSSVLELYEHMADHVKWIRYACKLCNFKHYNFEKLPEHVKIVHKLKGDSDFYHSTVKAIDGKEAMIISTCLAEPTIPEEANEIEAGPESRRPSRCSSDSSRLSDDSSSSTTFKDTSSRKRKMQQNKGSAKKKRDINDDENGQEERRVKLNWSESNNSPSLKGDENSSDTEDIEERLSSHLVEMKSSEPSRRPVRKRTKVKNADFEYDLSNLLKMEAQGYRESTTTIKVPQGYKDSQSTTTNKVTPVSTTKAPQTKKKAQPETSSNINNNEALNQECCGALMTLSKNAVENAIAHMKTSSFAVYSTKEQRPNVFARPMLPRILARNDKASPKKDDQDQTKICKMVESLSFKSTEINDNEIAFEKEDINKSKSDANLPEIIKMATMKDIEYESEFMDQNGTAPSTKERRSTSGGIPAVVPLKFRRQSLEYMKNHPIINKNITDFSKAGMKTKILVIKPIHRNKVGAGAANATPLKFQTIKLKDPNKGSSNEDKQADQVMVVKVPEVPCTSVSENLTYHDYTQKKCEETVVGCEDQTNTETKQKPFDQHKNDIVMEKECENDEIRPKSNSLVVDSANDEVAAT